MSLKDLLKEKNISQKDLSIRTGITEASISRYINKTRKMGLENNLVMEGRDIGTVVFPNANLKIYLDASEEERANRRFNKKNRIRIHIKKKWFN